MADKKSKPGPNQLPLEIVDENTNNNSMQALLAKTAQQLRANDKLISEMQKHLERINVTIWSNDSVYKKVTKIKNYLELIGYVKKK